MVLFSVFAYVAFGIFGIYCIVSGVRKQKEIKAAQQSPDYYMDEKEHDEAIKQIESFEKGYFERVRNGEQTQQFLAVGSNMMCSFLRSLLSAENIPTYTENEHVNSMYSLNALSGNSAFSIKVYILVADYDRAYEIISDFISKHESEENIEEYQEEIEHTEQRISASQLMIIVNYLKDAGAEAISINDQRIVNKTDFAQINDTSYIKINSQRVTAPFRIKAIGDPDYLKGSLIGTGYVDTMKKLGQIVEFNEPKNITINKFEGSMDFKYIEN